MNKHEILFEVYSKLGKKVRISKGYWNKITSVKHPIMKGKENIVRKTLFDPEEIRKSKNDPQVYLYYRSLGKYFNAVVVKHLNNEGFVITTYITDKIKEGKRVWKKSE